MVTPNLRMVTPNRGFLPREKLLMSMEGEKQLRTIREQQDNGNLQADVVLAQTLPCTRQVMERRRHHQRNRRQRQQRRLRPRPCSIEFLVLVFNTARQHREAQNQQDIADD